MNTIRELAIDNSAFELSCTPGYYNNEGSGCGEGVRSFLGDYYIGRASTPSTSCSRNGVPRATSTAWNSEDECLN